MKTLSELLAHVKDIDAKRYAPRGRWRELGEITPLLAEVVEKMKERLGPCMCEYERGCDYCETMAELDAIVAKGVGEK